MDKAMIEQMVGSAIPDDLYESAVQTAKRKLQSIIQRFGDHNGLRRKPEYLAELVVEAIKSELLMNHTLANALAICEHEKLKANLF